MSNNVENAEQLPVGSENNLDANSGISVNANTIGAAEEGIGFLTLEEVEKAHILQALELSGGSKVKAASLLGVSVKTVYNKLNSYNTSSNSSL
jgi:DNA-binding NtrC family response regulator